VIEIGKNSGNIHWVTKSKAYLREVGDIQINVTCLKSANANKYQASMILRNNQHKKFPSGYVMFGISGSRLYFVDSNSNDGYKLTIGSNNSSRYIKVSDETLVD
jgi:aspartate 1-decarboxylase